MSGGRRPGPQPATLAERFERDAVRGQDCWQWIGPVAATGYGRISWRGTRLYAHRVSYELHVGPIPAGLVIDHLCRNRLCVNPEHLEVVTIAENVARGDSPNQILRRRGECKHGHAATEENTYRSGSRRLCKPCHLARIRIARTAS